MRGLCRQGSIWMAQRLSVCLDSQMPIKDQRCCTHLHGTFLHVRMRSPMSYSSSRLDAETQMGSDKRLYLSFYHLPILHSQGLDRRVQNFTEGPFYTISLTSLNTREIGHHKKVISVRFLSPQSSSLLNPPSPPPSSELSEHSAPLFFLFISPLKDD